MLNSLTSQQINSLQLTDSENNVIYSGSTIFYMLQEYSARYMINVSNDTLLFRWAAYNEYKLPDFRRAYAALYSEYNPLNNYDMTEKAIDLENNGETDRTRSVDSDHNTVTVSNEYDYTVTTSADANDKPTTEHYSTTYDDVTAPGRLTTSDISSGTSTQQTTADGDNNNTVTTDDMTIINSETHIPTQMTVDDTTYTADNIKSHELSRSGNIGVTTSMELIQEELRLRTKSLVYDYVYDFISRYTFYASGGECYEYSFDDSE